MENKISNTKIIFLTGLFISVFFQAIAVAEVVYLKDGQISFTLICLRKIGKVSFGKWFLKSVVSTKLIPCQHGGSMFPNWVPDVNSWMKESILLYT